MKYDHFYGIYMRNLPFLFIFKALLGFPSIKNLSKRGRKHKEAVTIEVILFFLLLLSSSFPSPSSTTTTITGNETDMLSLVAFKSQLGSSSSSALSSWNTTNHFCGWIGVSCSSSTKKHPQRRVTALDLSYSSLAGFISPSLANLTFLTILNLSNNGFYGTIPPQLNFMHHLQILDLSFNSLHGEIPIRLTNSSNLMKLNLTSNNISGKIPVDLNSSKLRHLDLSNNSLTGEIPSSVGNLSSLMQFKVIINQLEGSIPYEIGRLQYLQEFRAGANKLSGTIPSSMFNLSSLSSFRVAYNQLEGSLPPTMGLTLPNLEIMLFGANQFEGPIPHSLPNATKLVMISIAYNKMRGTLPPNLGMLASLSYLNLQFNQLRTRSPNNMEFLTSLANCSRLEKLILVNNNISGELPNSIGNLSTNLQWLGLGGNHIVGHIPSEIGNLVNLTILELGQNHLTGTIPDSIGKLRRLQALGLYDNGLVGNIPSSLANLTNLIDLYLYINNLDGLIPPSLGTLQQLEELYLDKNRLSGTIPKDIFSIQSLRKISLQYNSLVGHIPFEIRNLKSLEWLLLAGNKLTNVIPSELGESQLLEILDLSQNLLNGNIASTFSNLKELQLLDLSQNNLSGHIPQFLESLSHTYVNLSFNHFEGEVPMKGIFQNASSISLQGNDGLCGGIRDLHLPPCPIKSTEKRGISLLLKVVIITTSILFILFTSLLFVYWKRKSRKENPSLPSSNDQYLRFSYIELAKATNGFSQANLIGTGRYGSVYKGTTDQGNNVIAVKVFNLEEQGAFKSFVDEYEALRHIRHRNLIKILTSCSSIDSQGNDFKALVFEFMPNGNLETWLHVKKSISLIQRLNIAIDVADALDYMHHDCQPPIVHCDLKPNNILLDNAMVAHVGDFGLAKSLQDSSYSVGIRGTIGYVAPEYGKGRKVSTSGDVYSYGILLLEMFTGRRPVDHMFKDGYNLHEFVAMAYPNRIVDVIDPLLLLQNDGEDSNGQGEICWSSRRGVQECIASVVSVGISCSKESPRERTNMRAVAMELHAIRDAFIRQGV